MNIIFKELIVTIKLANNNKISDILAYSSIKLIDEHERFITINGFTVRKSKFDNRPYLLAPSRSMGNKFFKFFLAEESLWKEIEKEIIKKYEYESIPIIDE